MKSDAPIKMAVIILVAAGIAAPIWTWHSARRADRARAEALRQQDEQLARLTADNKRLSNEVSRTQDRALTDGQLAELLRLRAEAGALLRQTNSIQRLQDQNRQLQIGANLGGKWMPPEKGGFDGEVLAEMTGAARQIIAELPGAQQRFASEHGGETAKDFTELRKYFPTVDGRRLPGLYSFQFVRDEGPQPGDRLILCELGSHPTPEGKRAMLHVFSDGRVVEVKQANGDDADGDFIIAWQKQHMNSAEP